MQEPVAPNQVYKYSRLQRSGQALRYGMQVGLLAALKSLAGIIFLGGMTGAALSLTVLIVVTLGAVLCMVGLAASGDGVGAALMFGSFFLLAFTGGIGLYISAKIADKAANFVTEDLPEGHFLRPTPLEANPILTDREALLRASGSDSLDGRGLLRPVAASLETAPQELLRPVRIDKHEEGSVM